MRPYFETTRSVVFPWHCDHYGHLNARWYVHHFDDSAFHIWTMAGCPHARNRAGGVDTVVARYTVNYLREMQAGQLLVVRCAFTRVGNRSVTHLHRMFDADHGTLHASLECVEVFFDPGTRSSMPMPEPVRALLTERLSDPEEDWSQGLGDWRPLPSSQEARPPSTRRGRGPSLPGGVATPGAQDESIASGRPRRPGAESGELP